MGEVIDEKRWQRDRDRDRDVCYDRHKKDIERINSLGEVTSGKRWQRDRDVCYERHKKDN